MIEEKPCVLLDWSDVYSLSKDVSEKIRESKWQPDVLVGIARGGWIPSRILCDFLGITDLLSIKVSHWGVTATSSKEAKVKYPVKEDLSEKKVLIADDISDTGETLKVAFDDIKDQNPSEIRTATLQNIKGSDFEPEYYSKEIDWVWVIYPWCFMEDMISLSAEVLEEGSKTTEEIIKDFNGYFDINIPKDRLRYSLEEGRKRNKIKKEKNYWSINGS